MAQLHIVTNDPEAVQMLKQLAKLDKRSVGNEFSVVIRQIWADRFSRPNPATTVGEAVQAGQTVACANGN